MNQPRDQLEHDAAFHDQFFLRHLQQVQGVAAGYHNLKFLGKGGNGTAFLVSCDSGPNLGLQLVLKVFHKISNDRRRAAFLEEIGYLRTFNHPSIVQIYDEGEYRVRERVYPFAVMEYVPHTVREALVSKQMNRLNAIRIALNCLSAFIG